MRFSVRGTFRLALYQAGVAVFLISRRTHAAQEQRIFPAARLERYSPQEDGILRTVRPKDFDIVISNSTDDNQEDVVSFLQAANKRYSKWLFLRPDYPATFSPRANVTRLVPLQRLVLTVTSNSTELHHGVDESYSLAIENATTNLAVLNATTVYGILRGLESFSQLVMFQGRVANGDDDKSVFSVPQSFWIDDAPEYSYRGLLIDTARHYLPLSLILANLDALAMNKLNVLHWHMTDSQSFPYRSLRYPELADMGAYGGADDRPSSSSSRQRMYYTPQDVQLVVREAKLRGIRVIPEMDVPGHSLAISKSHPELMSHCPKASEPLDPTNPAVYALLANLHLELSHLLPDQFAHVGGDEVPMDCWKNSISIQAWMKRKGMFHNETHLLYDYFEDKLLSIVANLNKTAIVWQEVFEHASTSLRNHQDTIVDVWKGGATRSAVIYDATLQGHRVIDSSCWYLDHLDKNWKDFYQCDLPRNFGRNSSKEQRHLVIGGKASMWGERVDATNFMSRVWPRASAVAERLWTGDAGNTSSSTSGQPRRSAAQSVEDRLAAFRCHMVARGIPAQPIGPGFCSHEPGYVHEKSRQRQQEDASIFEWMKV